MENQEATYWNLKTIFDCWGGAKSTEQVYRHETYSTYPKSAVNPIRFYFTTGEYHLALRLLNKLLKPANGVLHYWTEQGREYLAYTVPEKLSKKEQKNSR